MKERHEVYGFKPIVDNNTSVMILGTIPGEVSLAKNEYYADSNNKLWYLIGLKYGVQDLKFLDYNTKISVLKANNIGLWDILSFCTREGSSDKTIQNEQFNELKDFISQYPNIKKIIVNGKGAYKKYLQRINLSDNVEIVPLVSTSGSRWDCQSVKERDKWLSELPDNNNVVGDKQ